MKKIYRLFKMLNPYYFWKEVFTNFASQQVTSRKNVKEGYKKIIETGKQRMAEEDVDSMSYKEMLISWGIKESEIPQVLKGMNIERYSMLFMAACLGLPALFITVDTIDLSLFSSVLKVVMGLVLLALTGGVWVTRTWRIECLKNKTFTPFKSWLNSND